MLCSDNIVVAYTPHYALGNCITMQTRILIFNSKPESFFVDFMPLVWHPNVVFIIPEGHFCFLKPGSACQFLCFDVPDSLLAAVQRIILFRFKYFEHKSIFTNQANVFNFCGQIIVDAPLINDYLIVDMMEKLMEDAATEQKNLNNERLPNYINCADLLLKYIHHHEADLNNYNLEHIACRTECDIKMLNTACRILFRRSAQSVLKWHLLQQSFLLMMNPEMSVNAISKKLGFSDTSAYRKFLKSQTDCTAAELRIIANLALNR